MVLRSVAVPPRWRKSECDHYESGDVVSAVDDRPKPPEGREPDVVGGLMRTVWPKKDDPDVFRERVDQHASGERRGGEYPQTARRRVNGRPDFPIGIRRSSPARAR